MIQDSELKLDMREFTGALRLKTADEIFSLEPDEDGNEPSEEEIAEHAALLEHYKDMRLLVAYVRYKEHTVWVKLPVNLAMITDMPNFEEIIKPRILDTAKRTLEHNGIA